MSYRPAVRLALIGLSALALATLPGIAAAQPAPGGTAPAAQPVTRAQLSAQLDTNFKTLDSNGDQALNAAEFEAAQTRAIANTQASINKRIEAEFTKLDSNKDGQLSLAEFKAAAPSPRVTPTAELLQQFDRNKDGKVIADEYRATPLANFDRLDLNKDGTLSAQEQSAAKPK